MEIRKLLTNPFVVIPVAGGLAYLLFNTAKADNAKSTSENGKKLIKNFEGLRLKAYPDGSNYSIGYGHNAPDIYNGQTITQAQADTYFNADLQWVEKTINSNLKTPINQNQYDALASLVYNIGSGNFKISQVLKNLNQNNKQAAATAFMTWNKAGGNYNDVLNNRRKIEKKLFLS